jgi:hypothetical protein
MARKVSPIILVKGFRVVTAVLHLGLTLGLVGLHAHEEFHPHAQVAWTDPAAEHHGGHNHLACILFWSAVPSPAPPPSPPLLLWVVRSGDVLPPYLFTPFTTWRNSPLPRGPPSLA